MSENNKPDLANSKALFVLKIVTMSFAILACVVVVTATLTRWIMDLNQKIKESNTKIARASARIEKFRKSRIKHILNQRKQQLKEEKAAKKKRKNAAEPGDTDETARELDELEELDALTDEEAAIDGFDNELGELALDQQ